LSSGYFNKFQSFLCNFNHLRFDQLQVARQREANYTALEKGVKPLISTFLHHSENPLPVLI
ncbi:hypothetical protein K5D32_22115, partial [Pseudomonas cichorii]|uniref:hypothetical protein n=1 Tax=Pseudomonas cichorii TaxID=36746 RepID=UPI001C8A0ECB